MKSCIRLIGLVCAVIIFATSRMTTQASAAEVAPAPADDRRAANMLALPSAGKFALYDLFSVDVDERFTVKFRKGKEIAETRRVEVPGSDFIWTVNPTLVGGDGKKQIHLEGYNPAEAHGTGICDIHFTQRAAGVWLFIVYGDKSPIGCVEMVEEHDRIIFLATGRKDGKVQGVLFAPVTAKNLGTLRRDKEGARQFDKFINPILALFSVGIL